MSLLRKLDCPIYNAERTRNVPKIQDYTVTLHNCAKANVYALAELLCLFPLSVANSRMVSVTRWGVRADWSGVLWSDFVRWAEPDTGYTHVYFESFGGYSTAVWAEDMENPRIIMATGVGDDPLEVDYGGPFRMIIPNLWGYKSCKWLTKIAFMKEYHSGFWESVGYPDRGEIEPCLMLDINTGKYRRISGGEVMD